jgi:hypothetical protein
MKKRLSILLSVFVSILFFTSCQKVIEINLNKSAPKIIIEGSINDQLNSCYVKLSKTVNFDEPNTFPAVTGSSVSITDDMGNSVILSEKSPGYYIAPLYRGFAGRTYTVSVVSEGKTYNAHTTMDNRVDIDTLLQQGFFMGGFRGSSLVKYVRIQFHDPGGINNYYKFVQKVNQNISTTIYIDDDMLRDGNLMTQDIIQIDPALVTGDTITIYLETIDKPVYEYFSQLWQVSGEGYGGSSASPANPVSNFDNGALGYFSAYSLSSKIIVIK